MHKWLFTLFLFTSVAFGQQVINPNTQINWPQTTGAGAPISACASPNYGAVYTDVTNTVGYRCTALGWEATPIAGGNFPAALSFTPAGASGTLANLSAYSNLTSGYAIIGDSTWVVSNAYGATSDQNTAGYRVASALNMPLSQDYALAGAECSDIFPLMITPNGLNPGPGYGSIAAGQGWTAFEMGINDSLNLGVSSNAENFYTSACTAAAEFLGSGRVYKVLATDPAVTLAGGFASSSTIMTGAAVSTSNGATATIPITTTGNQLHILYAAYERGVVQSATYVSGGSVTGTAGQGCFVGTFNNSSTASATVVLTGTNTLAGAVISFNISHGTGATAAPTTAVLTNGSATCSGTITISSTLSPGGAAGATVGQAAVTIDGVTPGSNATLFAQAPGGITFTSILGTTATMMDAAYTVTAGAHTVALTTGNTGIFTVGGALSQGTYTSNPPALAYGGVLHQNTCASDSATGAYDTLNQTIASNLRADGFIATFVDYRSAVGCGTANSQANAGMNSTDTTMPDGSTCSGSTSPGSHPGNCGYSLEAQKFRSVIVPFTQNAGPSSASYTLNQGGTGQTVTANYDLQSFWRFTTNTNVNSGAWPVLSFYNHNGTNIVAGAYQYYDSTNGQFTFGDNGTLNYVSTPLGTESTFNDRWAFKNNGSKFTLAPTGGAVATLNIPSIGTTQAAQLQVASGVNPTASYTANTAFNLHEWGLANNVTTLVLGNSYAVQGGTTTTVYVCEPSSGGPWTIVAASDMLTSGPFAWPFATATNFNSAANQCTTVELVRLDANGGPNANKWIVKPYANLQLANTFTMPQTLPYTVPQTLYSAAGTALPTCAAGLKGASATVSDATAPTYMGAYTSGGAVTAAVICDGAGGWKTH